MTDWTAQHIATKELDPLLADLAKLHRELLNEGPHGWDAPELIEARDQLLHYAIWAHTLQNAILRHRGSFDLNGGSRDVDRTLWEAVASVPYHDIKGDG